MESKVCKGKLFVFGTCYNNGRYHVGDVYFLAEDLNKLDNLLAKNHFGECFNPEVIHLPMLLPGPLEFCKTQDLQFIYRFSNGVKSDDHLDLRMLGEVHETIYEGGDIYELLTKYNEFFTSKLLQEPIYSYKVKAIIYYCENIDKEDENKPLHLTGLHPESETLKQFLEISEKMTKVGLALTPEQENTLLHNVIDELSAEITSLKLKIESMD